MSSPKTEKIVYDEKTRSTLQLLLKNISSVNKAVELRAVLKESIEVAQDIMNAEAGSLMLLDENSGELIISFPTGPVKKEIEGKRIDKGAGIGGWVVENNKPYFSNDVTKSELFSGDISQNFRSENIICVPLRDRSRQVIGVLQAINRKDGDFHEGDIPVFQALADHIALAIERTREQQQIQNRLKEREMMLTEVHHRLKNNLTTITALIELELADVVDEKAREVLQKTITRIKSMTEVHDFLYKNKPGNEVKLKPYIERLAKKISRILSHPSQEVAIDVKAEDIYIDTERTMSCGLLLNELLVNSYKHAFDENAKDPRILIELKGKDHNQIVLKVSDNGSGISEGVSITESDSIGGWLIDVLIRRLEADIQILQDGGTTFVIHFNK